MIADDVLYLRVNDSNRADYERAGMQAFRPYRDRDEISMSYFQVPADVLEDPEMLVAWARKSVAVAKAAAIKSPRAAKRNPAHNERRRSSRPK